MAVIGGKAVVFGKARIGLLLAEAVEEVGAAGFFATFVPVS
jgi:hypothetical protein